MGEPWMNHIMADQQVTGDPWRSISHPWATMSDQQRFARLQIPACCSEVGPAETECLRKHSSAMWGRGSADGTCSSETGSPGAGHVRPRSRDARRRYRSRRTEANRCSIPVLGGSPTLQLNPPSPCRRHHPGYMSRQILKQTFVCYTYRLYPFYTFDFCMLVYPVFILSRLSIHSPAPPPSPLRRL